MSVGNPYSSKVTKNGTTHFRSQTCIPIVATTNEGDTATADIAIGNVTYFPQAAALAAVHDKVKFHKVKLSWVPALPTTAGGSVVMYFDTDRTDTGPTDLQDAMQNKGARSGPIWSKLTYVCDRKMLRSNEMFSTTSDQASSSATNNTFTSPGRLHLHYTSQPGINYNSTSVTVGFAVIEYEVEFMFQSAQEATDIVPTRRAVEKSRDTSFVRYGAHIVDIYRNFVAGCVKHLDFYTFLALFDDQGKLNIRKALEYQPDEISLSLAPSTSRSPSKGSFQIQRPEVGDLNPLTISGFSRCPSFSPDWNSETGSIYYD